MNLVTKTITVLASASLVGLGVAQAQAAPAHQTRTASAVEVARPAAAHKVTITIKNFGFTVAGPVAPGAKVTVHNDDSVTHTVTSNKKGLFNVRMPAHSTKTFTAPKKAGKYPFHCSIHTEMHGVLKVR